MKKFLLLLLSIPHLAHTMHSRRSRYSSHHSDIHCGWTSFIHTIFGHTPCPTALKAIVEGDEHTFIDHLSSSKINRRDPAEMSYADHILKSAPKEKTARFIYILLNHGFNPLNSTEKCPSLFQQVFDKQNLGLIKIIRYHQRTLPKDTFDKELRQKISWNAIDPFNIGLRVLLSESSISDYWAYPIPRDSFLEDRRSAQAPHNLRRDARKTWPTTPDI